MFKFEMSGFDKLNKKLKDLSRKAAAIDGTHSVPISELLIPSFVQRHTRFATVEEMFEASGFKIDSPEDFSAIPDDKWDEFIRSVSSFSSWNAMLQAATKDWTAKKLGL